MNNRIIDSLLQDYLDDFGIKEKSETVAFEYFCNYCMFTHNTPDAYSSDNFLYQDIHTGEGGDNAIDGILIMIDDEIITTIEQAKEIVEKNKKFDARFLFVQAKTSSSFDSGDMFKFGFGVRDFFCQKKLNANKKVLRYKIISDYIFNHSILMKSNPNCHLYYVTTGKWQEDANLLSVKNNVETALSDTNLFTEAKFIPIDAARLISVYKEIKNSITREIVIEKHVAYPAGIRLVEKAYLGLVKFEEYLKLITDEDGLLQLGLFYDNVRSYLGDNPVNKEISSTLEKQPKQVQFPILNNGITIVTKNLNVSGDKFTMTDYQIVNGCQTTNVLYKLRNKISPDMMIPVKIVNTMDSELINDVIRSTNRQTQVLDEAFESLKVFHKQLQDYYNTYKNPDKIYYERRSHEYDAECVKRTNIVTLPIQLLSVISMFFEEPHSVHRYYGELLRSYANRVFQPDHQLIMYYTSAWTLHQIEKAIKDKEIDVKWRPYRYHLLFLFQSYIRQLKKMKNVPRFNSNEMERLCKDILKTIDDKKMIGPVLRHLTGILEKALAQTPKGNGGNEPTRRKEFTLTALQEMEQKA